MPRKPKQKPVAAPPPPPPPPESMHVAYCIDVQGVGAAQFGDQLYASVRSLRDSRAPEDRIFCHVLYAHVSVELMERLHALERDGFKVVAQRIGEQDLAYWQQFTAHDPCSDLRTWSGIVFARVWLPFFLDRCERCVYLDADTLVRSSIAPLWNAKFPDGAVLGMNIGSVPEYGFNSGVMLMNLAAMRADKALYINLDAFLKKHARTFFLPDQTTINRFFAGRIFEIGREWNFPPTQGASDPALASARIWHFYNGGEKPRRIAADDAGRALLEWNAVLERKDPET